MRSQCHEVRNLNDRPCLCAGPGKPPASQQHYGFPRISSPALDCECQNRPPRPVTKSTCATPSPSVQVESSPIESSCGRFIRRLQAHRKIRDEWLRRRLAGPLAVFDPTPARVPSLPTRQRLLLIKGRAFDQNVQRSAKQSGPAVKPR